MCPSPVLSGHGRHCLLQLTCVSLSLGSSLLPTTQPTSLLSSPDLPHPQRRRPYPSSSIHRLLRRVPYRPTIFSRQASFLLCPTVPHPPFVSHIAGGGLLSPTNRRYRIAGWTSCRLPAYAEKSPTYLDIANHGYNTSVSFFIWRDSWYILTLRTNFKCMFDCLAEIVLLVSFWGILWL